MLLVSIGFLVLFSCKKEIDQHPGPSEFVSSIKNQLQDSMSVRDYLQLDFSKSYLSKIDTVGEHFFRVAFRNKNIGNEFLLLQVNHNGKIVNGRIVSIARHLTNNKRRDILFFNGVMGIRSLAGIPVFQSNISDGYIDAFHSNQLSQVGSNTLNSVYIVPSSGWMPEVIIVAYLSSGNAEASFNIMYALQSILFGAAGSSGINYSGYYNYSDPNATWGGTGGGGVGNGGGLPAGGNGPGNGNVNNYIPDVLDDNPVLIDFEPVENLPAIDVKAYLKCFGNIPDAGASCSVEILTDVPVDSDPTKIFNWQTGSPGHTFLQLRKTNGGQIVTQNIGFYPDQSWKTTLTPAPVNAKFADNGLHEFNASLKMSVNPEDFQHMLNEISQLSGIVKYDIDEYNCTDFALQVFNKFRTTSDLEIAKFQVPGGITPNGTSTPQALYEKLVSMKQAGGPEASNITIPGVKGWVGNSSGPCN